MSKWTHHYTYRVTFEDMPWYYYGLHSTNDLDDGYLGSPITHAIKWEMYEPSLQILEFFDSREEARALEIRLIDPVLNDPDCLNEANNGHFSEASFQKAWAAVRETQIRTGWAQLAKARQNRDPEERRRTCQKMGQQLVESGELLKRAERGREMQKRPIAIMLPDGNETVWDSLNSGCRALNLNAGAMSLVARGLANHHKQHKARYI